MAYSVIKAGDCGDSSIGYYYEYLCESDADIANLPTTAAGGGPRPGSLAYIESDSSARYILKINREWGEYPMASGGGGGNSGVLSVGLTMTELQDGLVMNKTAGEIIDALGAGRLVVGILQDQAEENKFDIFYVTGTSSGATYSVAAFAYQGGEAMQVEFSADTLDDYPVFSFGG